MQAQDSYPMTKEAFASVPRDYKISRGRGKANEKFCFAAFVPGCEKMIGTTLVPVHIAEAVAA